MHGFYVTDLRKKFKRPKHFYISKAEKDFVIDCLARKISEDYKKEGIERITLVPAMKGGIFFMVDFGRVLYNYGINPRYSNIDVGSYLDEKKSSGAIIKYYNDKKIEELEKLVRETPTLFMDEMVETGNTFNFSAGLLAKLGAQLKTATLILRPAVYYGSHFQLEFSRRLHYGGMYTLLNTSKKSQTKIKQLQHKRMIDYIGFLINKKPFLKGEGMDDREYSRFQEEITPVSPV